ncbi:MAG TPA: hypothetical protein VK054_01540 [Beutenbergiaceae bacterium]|nr:hypothetical protein [Beutenbergiaceae bacterium]
MSPRQRACLAGVVGAVALAVTACAGNTPENPAAEDPPIQGDSPSADPEGAGADVSFDFPSGWVNLSESDLEPAAEQTLNTLAEAAGLEAEELHANAQTADMFLVDPDFDDPAMPNNILVNHEPGDAVDGLPTEEEMAALFDDYGLTDEGYGERSGPIGEVVYGLAHGSAEGIEQHLGMVFTFNDAGDLVIVTVSVDNPADQNEITQTIAGSIEDT